MSHRIQHISKINRITDVKTTLHADVLLQGSLVLYFVEEPWPKCSNIALSAGVGATIC